MSLFKIQWINEWMINNLESLSASLGMKSVLLFRHIEVRHSKEDIFGHCLLFFQRTCALFQQFPTSASFFLLSEVSIQNEHIFAKCGCRTVKKWTWAHQCLLLCGQKEHTCEALWGKVVQRWKTQVEWRNGQTGLRTVSGCSSHHCNSRALLRQL